MENTTKRSLKQKALALGLAGSLFLFGGCNNTGDNNDFRLDTVPSRYNHFSHYYKTVIRNGEAVKVYKAENTFVVFDKETLEPTKYIFKKDDSYRDEYELYDLSTGKMLMYAEEAGLILPGTIYNYYHFRDVINGSYDVCLGQIGDYIEGAEQKEFYSEEEIDALIPQLLDAVKKIHNISKEDSPVLKLSL